MKTEGNILMPASSIAITKGEADVTDVEDALALLKKKKKAKTEMSKLLSCH